jgi:hypothetical protein
MLTPAKLAANRRNAQCSCGPRTAEGQARSAANAVKHGLRSRRVLLPGESAADFEQFCAALRDELMPDGPLEDGLVDRITGLLWRLRRVPWVEAGLLRAHAFENRRQRLLNGLLSSPPPVPATAWPSLDAEQRHAQRAENDVGRAFERVVLRSDSLTKLARYETTLDRALHRALWDFAALRSCRPRGPDVATTTNAISDDRLARRAANRMVVRAAGTRDRSVR